MGRYFGTDGFRGEANMNLTADHAYQVGRFLGWYYNEKRARAAEEGRAAKEGPARIVIGKDTRRSSYMFEYALVAGLVASGADAYMLHVTTTPSVAYIARVDDFDCGIMISASHNPYFDNGIKLINDQGEKMDEETIALVEDYLDGKLVAFGQEWPELPFAHKEKIGCTVDYVSGRNRYIGYLISLGMYSFRGVKVGLDCANGSSWNIAKAVFDALGADTYVINNQPNGLNINFDAGSTHIEGLQKFVVEKGLDVGFAYDGDADRCLCVDEKGNVISGDHILYIYGRYMKERGKLVTNTVVTTVMSNFGLYKAFDELGIDYAKTAVGDKYVYEYMQQSGARIGGEQSGHIIFSKYASTGDGILTSLKMMEVMMAQKKPMSELAAPLKIYPQVLKNIRVTDKTAAQNDPAVQAMVAQVTQELGDTGRILVRESGTEPVLRVMVEAPEEEICQKYVDGVVKVIQEKGYVTE
jgi:phosphoglucosamine mutase